MQDGKTVIITGGAIGLGRELTRRYHALGYTVVICGRTQAALDETERECPGVVAVCADLAAS